MFLHQRSAIVIVSLLLSGWSAAAGRVLTLRAENQTGLSRSNQTIELSSTILAPLGEVDLDVIHVADASGLELLCQAVDTDFDAYRQADILIFQADFQPNETRFFTLTVGAKHQYAKEQYRAFGRFVRERFDDFAWENDRIAHRTYGRALETWEGEPLSSSTVDIWSKRTSGMVINDWYLTGNYHADHGEGADFYSAGLSRGCGGNGLWAADRLWVSRTFVESRVLANGPIRVLFELVYEPFDVDGVSVSEVKRVSLDAGQQLDHFECHYKAYTRPGKEMKLVNGIGLKKVAGERLELNEEQGWLVKWEQVAKNAGQQGLAIIVDPASVSRKTEDVLNQLLLVNVPPSGVVSYWAGFCWDQAGPIKSFEGWKQYVADFARELNSPIKVTLESEK